MTTGKIKGYRHLPAFILLALAHAPGHGAALLTRLRDMLPLGTLDSGAVYRTLNALEQGGEIWGEWDTSTPGPARKIYCMTSVGWERLEFWREDIAYRVQLLTIFLDVSHGILSAREDCSKAAAMEGGVS